MGSDLLPVPGESPFPTVQINEAVFENLFTQNFAPLCAYCEIRFGMPPSSAKDIVQSAFLKFWESRANISSPVVAKSYLYKIVINSSLDLIKHQKVKTRTEKHLQLAGEPALLQNGYEHIDFRELNAAMEAAISELPDQMRKIFILCKVQGMKYSEAADVLNISVKTVETQMSRALSRLREKLAKFAGYLLLLF